MKLLFVKIIKINSKFILKVFLILFTIFLIIYSKTNIQAVVSSISLFFSKVFPSLFPFFIATELLSHTNIINILNNLLSPFMKRIFNVSGSCSFPFLMGMISGYPTGAKILSDFRKNNICSKEECERMLAYTNNSGPLFIIGTVGTSLFFNTEIGYLLLFAHILGAITVGIIFRNYKNTRSTSEVEELSISNFSTVLTNSIYNSFKTLGMILGYIILFSIIINIIVSSHILDIFNTLPYSIWIKSILLSFLEITNGINLISSIYSKSLIPNIVITSFFLGFGGLSVLLQVYSIISKTDLSIKPYIIGKLLHGTISLVYTTIFLLVIPIFNFAV